MEPLKHECGVAMIRLLRPLEYYVRKYGTPRYALDKLYLMMEKQHNRGQEGAGIAGVSLDAPPGAEYMFRERAEGKDAITEIFRRTADRLPADMSSCQLLMGHLRYSTTGRHGLQYVHPFLRRNNWRARNLALCGNFNLTNIDEVFGHLVGQGQSPRAVADAYLTLELMGHRLDREVERLYAEARAAGLEGTDITRHIDDHVAMPRVLRTTLSHFDGGYVLCGLTGSGEFFAVRDPWGIRPAFFYRDDEVVVVASERPVIQTCFCLPASAVGEIGPGQALVVNRSGSVSLEQTMPAGQLSACSFERIYFSRASDADVYAERKQLGRQLAPSVLQAVGGDVANTVFSYIPNTAEVAFHGLADGLRSMGHHVRAEKVVWKDVKLRTFIAQDAERAQMAAHVYDVTYGSLRPGSDNLVVVDDSIVRGTTLRQSILAMLGRLEPRRIVVVSSAPQVRYPDFYGIDTPSLGELSAFRAAMALIRERGMEHLVAEVLGRCRREPRAANHVRAIYAPFTVEEINRKMAELLRPEGLQTPVKLVFQSIEGLHEACPRHPGDWYFTGRYPTEGGIRLVNQAFINYCCCPGKV